MKILGILIVTIFLPGAEESLATQANGNLEVIYAHQIAHLFFMLSMILFIYWIRQRKLVTHTGWRYIQYAAGFFILWNINLLLVHFLDEQSMLITTEKISILQIRVSSSLGKWVEIIYYVSELDHFIGVPALLFLFLGLKKLAAETEEPPEDAIQ